jgi:hypothetical protein
MARIGGQSVMMPDKDVARLMNHIKVKVDLAKTATEQTRYWASLPLCVIDSVWSIQAKYETQVLPLIDRFCRSHNPQWDGQDHARRSGSGPTIKEFVDILDNRLAQGATYDTLFSNRQRTSSWGGILKAEAVHRFAKALLDSGINRYSDVKRQRKLAEAEHRIISIPGQRSGLTFTYFLMLSGETNYVKGDTHIRRFVSDALSIDQHRLVDQNQAAMLLTQAATRLAIDNPGLTPLKLDFAVWNYQRALKWN